jgi:molybdate transport system ATP-binding protein
MIEAHIVKRFAARRDSAGFELDVEFTAGPGVTVLFGPSGSGKTLTLDAIAGFAHPNEGRILIDDRIVFDAQSRVFLPPRKRRCGYVFQNYALFPHMTLRQNLEFGADRLKGLEKHRRINEMLERFRLGEVAGRKPHELSGGQKQRCSIARALIGSPPVLLLDEAARGLDPVLLADFYEVLRQVRTDYATPILLVTHSLDEVFELGEQLIVLQSGRLVQSGTPAEVADQPASLDVARLLGVFNILPVEIRALDPGRRSSALRYGEFEMIGPYFPGHLIGDRVHVCIAPERVRTAPKDGKPATNQMPVQVARAVEKPQSVRLEFTGGLAAEISRDEYELRKHVRDWVVEFPASALRLV